MSKADDPKFRSERAHKGGAATARYWQDVKIAAAVDKVVDAAPQLTTEQLSRLRAVLTPAVEKVASERAEAKAS